MSNENLYFIKYGTKKDKYNKYKYYFTNKIISVKIKQAGKYFQAKCDLIGCKYPEKRLYKNLLRKGSYYLEYKLKKYKLGNYSIYYIKNYPTFYDVSDNFKYKRLQEKSLSCESSAAADILSKRLNKNILEKEVISKLPKSNYYNKLPIRSTGKMIWGNPQEGFVGYIGHTNNIRAYQSTKTGYGVLEKPIKKVYLSYGLEARQIKKDSYKNNKELLTKILKELVHGADIQLWGDYCTYPEEEDGKVRNLSKSQLDRGYNGKNLCVYPKSERKFEWYYRGKDGNLIKHIGLNGEHAFYLLGYSGKISDPKLILIWDTETGKHYYSQKEWLRKWAKMDNRYLIIK